MHYRCRYHHTKATLPITTPPMIVVLFSQVKTEKEFFMTRLILAAVVVFLAACQPPGAKVGRAVGGDIA